MAKGSGGGGASGGTGRERRAAYMTAAASAMRRSVTARSTGNERLANRYYREYRRNFGRAQSIRYDG